jgi:hypothetical protein
LSGTRSSAANFFPAAASRRWRSVVDGPYVESKELIGGFAMLEYPTRDAAIDGARRFLEVAGDGECITYQIMEGGKDC